MRHSAPADPFKPVYDAQLFWVRPEWPARWVFSADAPIAPLPAVVMLRLKVSVDKPCEVRVRVSADEHYELRQDGRLIGAGPERGTPDEWFYTTYDLRLSGATTLTAKVWALGSAGPLAQMSLGRGFLLASEDPAFRTILNTGEAAWETRVLPGYEWIHQPHYAFDGWVGLRQRLDAAALDWAAEAGQGEGWAKAIVVARACAEHPTDLEPVRLLTPATLPSIAAGPHAPQKVRHIDAPPSFDARTFQVKRANHLAEETAWHALLERNEPVRVPAHTRRRVLLEWNEYVCVYPALTARGAGGRIRIALAECLFRSPDAHPQSDKGNRNDIEGKYTIASGDTYELTATSRSLRPLWWLAGRYVEIVIEAGAEPVVIEAVVFEETRYPMKWESTFRCDDPRWDKLHAVMRRTIEVESHDTFMDSPYYEQLSYIADSRLEALCHYVGALDARLPRKMIHLFGRGPLPRGFLESRRPCRRRQSIPTFSLLWVFMLKEHAWWRNDGELLREQWPVARRVLDGYLAMRDEGGLVLGPPGWNFIDWVTGPGWEAGVPPGGHGGASAPANWLVAWTLAEAAQVERAIGEPEAAERWLRHARSIAAACEKFWDADRKLFADTPGGSTFCEHSQVFALCSGLVSEEKVPHLRHALFNPPEYPRATFFFMHFVFEALRRVGEGNSIWSRLDPWYALLENGLITTPEVPDPTRSDCHGWSSHPMYHAFATVLGVRPTTTGFRTLEIRPEPGPLREIDATLPHPRGRIRVEYRRNDSGTTFVVDMPPETNGILVWQGKTHPLTPGGQTRIDLASRPVEAVACPVHAH